MNKFLVAAVVLLLPTVAFAQGDLTTVFTRVFSFINSVVIPLIFALAFIWFLWNIFQFFFVSTPKNENLRDQILYSVIGLFVMLSIWGIVALLQNSLGVTGTSMPGLPDIQQNNTTGGSGSTFTGTSI